MNNMISYYYKKAFFILSNPISKEQDRDDSNAIGGYIMISLMLMGNLSAIGLILKYYNLIPEKFSIITFFIFFLIPPFIFNYFYLFRKKRYKLIVNKYMEEIEGGRKKNYGAIFIYFAATISLMFSAVLPFLS